MPHVIGGSRRASQDLPGAAPDPAAILELGMGFWASKTLLSAVELGLFTELADGPLDAEALRARLGLHPRGARDFLDALVALGMLRARRATRYAQHAGDRPVPRPRQAPLRRRHARDGQRPPLPVLGLAHRGAAHRPAAERGQGAAGTSSAALYAGPGAAAAVPARHDRPQLGAARRSPRSSPGTSYRDVRRRRQRRGRRAGAGRPARTRTSPAAASTCRAVGPSSRTTSPASASRTGCASTPATSSTTRCPRRTCWSWGTSSTTGTWTRSDAAGQGLRGAARRRGADRLRGHHRRRAADQRLRPADEPEHADRDARRLRLHRRRLPALDARSRLPETRVEHLAGPDSMVVGIKRTWSTGRSPRG